ncbi:hypothetical protein CSUI_008624, partial [Cystoisospora suis]
MLTWRDRRCLISTSAFFYSHLPPPHPPPLPPLSPSSSLEDSKRNLLQANQGENKPKQTTPTHNALRRRRRRWSCISLRDCVQLLPLPHEADVFLLQTHARSFYWKAKSHSERDAWLVCIANQCVGLRDGDLLRDAELAILSNEGKKTRHMVCLDVWVSIQLDGLEKLYQLEGTLHFTDSRQLFEGFVIDFSRSLVDRKQKEDMKKTKRRKERKRRDAASASTTTTTAPSPPGRPSPLLKEGGKEEEDQKDAQSQEESCKDEEEEEEEDSLLHGEENLPLPPYPLERVLLFIQSQDSAVRPRFSDLRHPPNSLKSSASSPPSSID